MSVKRRKSEESEEENQEERKWRNGENKMLI